MKRVIGLIVALLLGVRVYWNMTRPQPARA